MTKDRTHITTLVRTHFAVGFPVCIETKTCATCATPAQVYTGGIGSYALITMVAAFLQLHTSRRKGTSSHPQAAKNPTASASKSGSKPGSSNTKKEEQASLLEPSLGVLLVDFFRLFGRVINTNEVGVACGSGGHFFQKHNKVCVIVCVCVKHKVLIALLRRRVHHVHRFVGPWLHLFRMRGNQFASDGWSCCCVLYQAYFCVPLLLVVWCINTERCGLVQR